MFEIVEVLQHCNASLGYSIDKVFFACETFLNKTLRNEEVEVLFEDFAVDVGLVHDMRQFQGALVSEDFEDVNAGF